MNPVLIYEEKTPLRTLADCRSWFQTELCWLTLNAEGDERCSAFVARKEHFEKVIDICHEAGTSLTPEACELLWKDVRIANEILYDIRGYYSPSLVELNRGKCITNV